MTKDDSVYLGHMLDQARKVVGKVQGKARADFDADENLRLALAHIVQTIGEAARRVSEATKDAHPEVPWRNIMGMRHRIVHDYMNVDEDILWTVATVHLTTLADQLAAVAPMELDLGKAGGDGSEKKSAR
jgi:uncharacterized protein with HEPN domain